mgnify:CR=1 FL=1
MSFMNRIFMFLGIHIMSDIYLAHAPDTLSNRRWRDWWASWLEWSLPSSAGLIFSCFSTELPLLTRRKRERFLGSWQITFLPTKIGLDRLDCIFSLCDTLWELRTHHHPVQGPAGFSLHKLPRHWPFLPSQGGGAREHEWRVVTGVFMAINIILGFRAPCLLLPVLNHIRRAHKERPR